jgi:ketosteroid isomerase-like protein
VNFASAEAVEAAFYRAFRHGDVDAMARVWLDGPEVSCIHPGRTGLCGHDAVMASWRAILQAGDGFQIQFRLDSEFSSDRLVVRIGTEHLRIEGRSDAVLSVTNAFQRTPGGWLMVLHHAAPAHEGASPARPLH